MAAFAAALTSAIPVIDKIVSAIWPDPSKKKTKDQASPAVSDLKAASADALKSVSEELSVVATLLDACLPAEDSIVSMRAVLNANDKGTLSEADKLSLQKWWKNVKRQIKKISDAGTKKSVEALSDIFTKATFLEVINADTDSIDVDMTQWSLGPLTKDVESLYRSLNKVNTIASQVVGDISAGLMKLSAAQKKTTPAPKGTKSPV
jgi:hypothetical protein